MNKALSPSLIFMITLWMLSSVSCTGKKTKVQEYVDALNFEHQLVINRLDALERSMEEYIPEQMDKAYQRALHQLDSSEAAIQSLDHFQGEDDLRDDARILFDTYRILLQDEYSEIISRQKKPAGSFTPADEFLVNNLGKHIAKNRKRAREKFEMEVTVILQKYDIPFASVTSPVEEINSSKKRDSTAQVP